MQTPCAALPLRTVRQPFFFVFSVYLLLRPAASEIWLSDDQILRFFPRQLLHSRISATASAVAAPILIRAE